jgi:mRNA interferase MazF
MIDCERWDVLTALFPFTDVAARKPRPVLVLSHDGFNRRHGHVIS